MKITIREILILALLGLIAQSIFTAGNLNSNGFYNRYLGFTVLLPVYAIFLSSFINHFHLKSKKTILPLSIFLLSIVGFINFSLYPTMGGSVGQLYGIILIYGILPASLVFGGLYGMYITYRIRYAHTANNKQNEQDPSPIPTDNQSALYNQKHIIIIWIIGLSVILLSFFSYVQYQNILIPIIGLIIGAGLIMRIKWIRWILLTALYTILFQAIYLLIIDYGLHSSDNYSFLAMIINFIFVIIIVWLLSNKESFLLYQLDESIRVKEIVFLSTVSILIITALQMIE